MQILFTSLYEHWNSEYFFEGANQLIVFIFLLQNKFPIHFRARALLFNFLSARRTKWRASFFFERVFVNHCHWHIVECACVWLQPEESHANDNPIIRASRQLLSCLSWWINVFFFPVKVCVPVFLLPFNANFKLVLRRNASKMCAVKPALIEV